MKYIILAIMLFVPSLVVAGGPAPSATLHEQNVQQQLKETPEMSEYCKDITTYYKKKVEKYEKKLALKPESKFYQRKLSYYKKQSRNATNYCKKEEE